MNDPRIVKMPLTALLERQHPGNPKLHDLEMICASYRRFGFVTPLMLDEATATLVAGHGRLGALRLMKERDEFPPNGIEDDGTNWLVPVVRGVSFKNDRERDAYLIADNANVEKGGWDDTLLSEMLGKLADSGATFDGIGLGEDELNSLLGNYVPPPPPDDDESPPPAEPDRPATQITATITCPHCGEQFTR